MKVVTLIHFLTRSAIFRSRFRGRFYFGVIFTEKTKEYYISALKETAEKEKRLPKKSDFTQDDVNRIKGFFGPWPWALEAAGLKESKQEARKAANREKRIRAKERKNEFRNNQNGKEQV